MTVHGGGVWMTVAHVLATIACVLVLTRGEAAVWTLWQRLLGQVPAALITHAFPFAAATTVEAVLTSHLTTSRLRVRGPPRAGRPA